MKCMKCDSSDVFIFLVEKIPCDVCDHYLAISYCTCNSCGNIWRNVDGSPIEENFMHNFVPRPFKYNELDEVSLEEIERSINMLEEACGESDCHNTMAEMFHKCLRCNHIAYETSKNFFHCPDCGFEWEVL